MSRKYQTLEYVNSYKLILCLMVVVGHFYNYIGGRYIWGIRLIGAFGSPAVILPFPDIKDLLVHFTMMHGVFLKYNTTILGPAWYMGTEWICILLSPIIVSVIHYKGKLSYVIKTSILIWGCVLLGLYISRDTDMLQTFVRNFPLFLCGMIIAEVYFEKCNKAFGLTNLVIISVYLMLLDFKQNWLSCGLIWCIVILIFWGESVFLFQIIKKLLEVSIFRKLSKMTYSIYMFHMIMIPAAFKIAYECGLNGFLMCVTAGVISIILILIV